MTVMSYAYTVNNNGYYKTSLIIINVLQINLNIIKLSIQPPDSQYYMNPDCYDVGLPDYISGLLFLHILHYF